MIALRPRTVVALVLAASVGFAAFAWPLFVAPASPLAGTTQAPFVFALALPVVVGVVLVELSDEGIDAKALAMLGVLAALGAFLRPLGAGVAGLEFVFFLIIGGGRVFGAGFGFALGALVLLVSGLLTGGVGPWLPFQMIGAAYVGLGAGLLPRARGRAEIFLLCAYGVFASLAYGILLDLAFWPFTIGVGGGLSYVAGAPLGDNLHRFAVYCLVTAMGWNVGRAVSTVLLLVAVGPALLRVLRRASRRAVLLDPTA